MEKKLIIPAITILLLLGCDPRGDTFEIQKNHMTNEWRVIRVLVDNGSHIRYETIEHVGDSVSCAKLLPVLVKKEQERMHQQKVEDSWETIR